MAEHAPVLTIDGPGGAGKGTVSQMLAERLGWHYLDSGAMYRVTALAARRGCVAFDNEADVAALARALPVSFEPVQGGAPRVLLDGEEVSGDIRTEQAGSDASRVAALPEVRVALLERQRAFRQAPGLVADGRDMGTTVFPAAALKVFLTASPEERARRRHKQLKEKGIESSIAQLSREIAERDERDSQRAASPLKPADDAVTLDTTGLSIDQVVGRIGDWLASRLA